MKLTPKQEAFIDYYIETGNATESAIRAGYSKRSAKEVGCQNLTKHNIKLQIEARNKEIKDNRIADMQEVKKFWTNLLRNDEADYRDRLKATEFIAKTNGAFLDKIESKNETEITVKLEGEIDEWSK